jgi:hypothetical protein
MTTKSTALLPPPPPPPPRRPPSSADNDGDVPGAGAEAEAAAAAAAAADEDNGPLSLPAGQREDAHPVARSQVRARCASVSHAAAAPPPPREGAPPSSPGVGGMRSGSAALAPRAFMQVVMSLPTRSKALLRTRARGAQERGRATVREDRERIDRGTPRCRVSAQPHMRWYGMGTLASSARSRVRWSHDRRPTPSRRLSPVGEPLLE